MASEHDENEGSVHASLEENLKIEITNQEREEIKKKNQNMTEVFTTTADLCKESTEFFYSMDTGFVLLVNNVNFGGSDHKQRTGSDEDVKGIQRFFGEILGWRVDVKNDLKASEIEQVVTNTSQCEDFPYKALFIIIFTHGTQQGVQGVNEEHVKVQSLVDKFKTTHAKKVFWKIPKFFVIQACRGDKQDLPQRDGPGQQTKYLHEDVYKEARSFFPQISNFLVAHPSLEGYEALRSEKQGSWFIQEFLKVTRQFYKTEDIVSIFSRVNFKVSNIMCQTHVKQMPIYEVGLRQRCFFPQYFTRLQKIYEKFNPKKENENSEEIRETGDIARGVSDDKADLDRREEARNVEAVMENESRTSEPVTGEPVENEFRTSELVTGKPV